MKAERPRIDGEIPCADDGLYLYEDPTEMFGDDTETTDELTVLAFALGDEWYAVDVTSVVEVLDLQPVTKLPNLPDYVIGVANVRGSITSVVDLLRMMNVGTTTMGVESRILVVEGEGVTTALLVDDVGAVTSITVDSIQPSLSTVPETEAAYSRGQVEFADGTVVTLLDMSQVMRSSRMRFENE